MATKPGAWDLRCTEAVLSAFLMHPRYRKRPDFLEAGEDVVRRGNWAFARYLPQSRARTALECVLPDVARRQRPSGMWYRKHAEEYSYPILLALARAGILEPLARDKTLPYDPFARFASSAFSNSAPLPARRACEGRFAGY